ncbi:Xylose isomerase-like TIM barrel [Caulifigura coniformis]|uniref:Xylose isomerase-like TIM barrel n=1 Tax=Caulifigura coniformis TaxID=2527983 RepID=A0A517SC34_9PLAN|nr:TIM barrel protein [Caulifigura coniformis]QDT53656.1 Xylose isomerase-like TIM barrel [Caulifigura coniformis]
MKHVTTHGLSRRNALKTAGLATVAALGGGPHVRSARAETPSGTPLKFGLGLVTYNVAKDWDLPTILKVCKASGVAAVELRTTHKHGVEPTLSAAERKDVKKRFEDSGIVCWGAGSTCEFHAADASVVKQNIETCKQFVDLVHDIGGKGVKVRPNGLRKDVPAEKTLEQIGKALIECGKAAEAQGVEIWMEVHGNPTQQPAHCKTIMEQCGHKSVGLTWNSNGPDVKDGSVKESFEMLWPWIKSCHINDLYKDGAGIYPYRELFSLFRAKGYDRYTLIEVGKTPADPAAGEEFLKYYKALWTELASR